jgi:hypothetical protein
MLVAAQVKGQHRIRLNGQEKAFSIDSIQVVPEGAGAWWLKYASPMKIFWEVQENVLLHDRSETGYESNR